MTTKVLHLLEGVSSGGASRNTLAMANYSACLEMVQHRIVSLMPASDDGRILAATYGIFIVDAPSESLLMKEIEDADIVQISYWNCPRINSILNLLLPPMRLSIWFRVLGASPPQIITSILLDLADVAIMTSPCSVTLDVCQDFLRNTRRSSIEVVYGPADLDRVANTRSKQHDTFNVGYIGTVDFVKMHPNYVTMSSLVNIPNVRFVICGKGAIDDSTEQRLRRQASELGKAHLFDFRGHIDDIRSVISELDVFGYPLCEETFATSEASLQEVMFAGVPPVVFPHGGVRNLVLDRETGLVVHNEQEYAQAIEYLYNHPEERRRLGENARAYARRFFGAKNAAAQMNRIYTSMMGFTKRQRSPILAAAAHQQNLRPGKLSVSSASPSTSGAHLFAISLGSYGAPFLTSLYSENESETLAADEEMAGWAGSYLMTSMGYGSVFHYRSAYPDDPYLHLWCGLMLHRLHKYSMAVNEFRSAIALGCCPQRVHRYLAMAAADAGNEE